MDGLLGRSDGRCRVIAESSIATRAGKTYEQPLTPAPIRRDRDDETAGKRRSLTTATAQIAIMLASAKVMAIYALVTGRDQKRTWTVRFIAPQKT